MNPIGCSWQTKVPSPSIDIVSFKSPTVPCQIPMISSIFCLPDRWWIICTGRHTKSQDDYSDCPYPRRAIRFHEINSVPPFSLKSVMDGATGAIASFTIVCDSSRMSRRRSAPRKLVTSLGTLTSMTGSAGFPANGLTFMTLSSNVVVTYAPGSPSTCRRACWTGVSENPLLHFSISSSTSSAPSA